MSEETATAEVQTAKISILGVDFTVTTPYAAGHTINEAEARALNQTRRENLGNNFRRKIADAIEADAKAKGIDPKEHKGENLPAEVVSALAAEFEKADAEYVFTLANTSSSRAMTPEEKAAKDIANKLVRDKLAKAGLTIFKDEGMSEAELADHPSDKFYPRSLFKEKVAEVAMLPKVVAEAKRRVERERQQAKKLLEGDDGFAL